ncbi:MAG: hypothetical protein FWE36_06490 [Erysipelotrichales bacterium]|nr:hypothetical protein [Erysipelotrichales bacterium]
MNLLPIPSHLEGILNIDKKSKEKQLIASLICCGQESFIVNTHNGELITKVTATCTICNKEIVVFDNRFHGWDGFICHLFRNEIEGEAIEESCKKCKKNIFKACISILSEGKQDFIEEACNGFVDEAQRTFSPDEWVNGFGWINISLECSNCGKNKDFIDYETM